MKHVRVALLLALIAPTATSAADPPTMLWQGEAIRDVGAAGGARTATAVMRMPGGGFAFYNRHRPADGPVRLPDSAGRLHRLLPHLPAEILQSRLVLDSGVLDNAQVVLGRDGEVKRLFVRDEPLDKQQAARAGLPRYLNVWMHRAGPDGAHEPKMIWRGYNGSQMEYQQLAGGRLLAPHGSFQPHARAVPPSGRHKTIVQYSDDGGVTWSVSESKLTAPCYEGFNGSNEGACEPAFEELNDGRLWMLMRTQAGFLYESFSTDQGTTWTEARASRFNTSTGPPNIMRHRNGWLVVTWNNCEMPPRHQRQGVYGGRDALHIAVSSDDGKTWRGFREIYLDHRRNENPARSGDRGTAYPLAAYTDDGTIVVIAGQGEGGRNPILVDPDWIVETRAETDFSDGLKQWSVYKHHGPAKRWWRARAVGCRLIADPADARSRCLNIRRPDELPADGATWNFPNGWRGSLTAHVMVRDGCQGAAICLNDRMFDPTNDWGEEFAVFRADIEPDGAVGDAKLSPGTWSEFTFDWDLSEESCRLSVNGKLAATLPLRHPTLNGVNYVRFRSTAADIDTRGILLRSVSVSIADPQAPACTSEQQREHMLRYVQQVVPLWREAVSADELAR